MNVDDAGAARDTRGTGPERRESPHVRQGLAHLGAAEVVTIATRTKDGRELRTPVGAAVADGHAYIRSQSGDAGAWYRRALRTGSAVFVDGDQRYPATLDRVVDAQELRRSEAATLAKYGGPLRNLVLRVLLLRTRGHVLRVTLHD